MTIAVLMIILGAFALGILGTISYYELVVLENLTTPSWQVVIATFTASAFFFVGLCGAVAVWMGEK